MLLNLRRHLCHSLQERPEEVRQRRVSGLALFLTFRASSAGTHDFFPLPSDFTPVVGQPVANDATVSATFPRLETTVTIDRMRGMDLRFDGKNAPLQVMGSGTNAHLTY